MKFCSVIEEIMREVDGGSKRPFIIYRNKSGRWNYSFTKDLEGNDIGYPRGTSDPFATVHCGEDFARGSFSTVYDRVLVARLFAEYHAFSDDDESKEEFNALANIVEDNIGYLSQNVIDYILRCKNPLATIGGAISFSIKGDSGEIYDECHVDKVLKIIRSKPREVKNGA